MNIVLIGCGTIGRTVIEHAIKEKHNITIVDDDKRKVEELIERFDVMGVVGNGACIDIQEEAGVANADLVITLTQNDEINILAALVAKKLGAESTIARVRNPEYKKQVELMKDELGISLIINPERATAEEIVNMINIPSVLKLEKFAKGKVNLVEILLEKGNPLIGETLITMQKVVKTKVLICAVQRGEEVFIPSGHFKMAEGDRLNITADANSLVSFLKEVNLIKSPLKDIMIIGGGKIAYYLASELVSKHYNVKIIENNPQRADEIAELLPKATVIYGDGTDHDLLIEEGIEGIDACVVLTNVDEENIIASMYAKKQKAKKVIAKVKKTSFLGMVGELGIANVVSPKEIIASQIISYLRAISNDRGSNVITLYKLVDNKIEALEFLARKKEKFYNKPLKELKTKENCLIACIIRNGQVIIPGGNDFIQQNDSVVVVTTHEQFDDLSDVFE